MTSLSIIASNISGRRFKCLLQSILAAAECKVVCVRTQDSVKQATATGVATDSQPVLEFAHDARHLQQIQQLEKRLFAKSDGWRGGFLTAVATCATAAATAAAAVGHACI